MKQVSDSDVIKIVVVGMNPSTYPTFLEHRKNHTFDRLYQWMDSLCVPVFSFINVWHTPDKFKISEIDRDYLSEAIQTYDKVLALGNVPSNVLTRINKKHFKLPHPSPRNRLLNSPDYEAKVLYQCLHYIWSE